MNAFEELHPSLQYHMVNSLGWHSLRPTQLAAIAPIHQGVHCLLLAPTAGGKTEAAIIPILSRMLKESWPAGGVLYVCPIKALLNNLEHRLSRYAKLVGRRAEVWHGDVSQSRKKKALKEPPDILLTTPESLESMLISVGINKPTWFGHLRVVVVDELHAFAGDDRGWHLRSVLQRLDEYLQHPLQRIGLSATVSNPNQLLDWLAPAGNKCVVGQAHVSTDAEVVIDHVESLENAATVISRLYRGEKRLVFCDSRGTAERLSSLLRSTQIRTFVSHASLSAAERKQAETAFAQEKDCVIVATSTLELGIDVGDLDRVIQIDSPSTVSSFLQRMGRTGRRVASRRNCLFLTTTQESFLLALGITHLWSQGWVEAAYPPKEPWPIAAQQLLVSVLEQSQWTDKDLLARMRRCFPEYPIESCRVLLQHMVHHAYLVHQDGLIAMGPRAEQEFGRGNYRELLTSFQSAPLLTARYGGTEIGYMDPSVLTGDALQQLVLLAGRSWQIKEVDWKKRVVWLAPAKEGGKARWMGNARGWSRDVCQGIRAVLLGGVSDAVQLSKRSKLALAALTDAAAVSMQTEWVLRTDGNQTRTWTFAGTNANRTYARVGEVNGLRVKFDALSVQAQLMDLKSEIQSFDAKDMKFSPQEYASFSQTIKFSNCIPSELLALTIQARHFSDINI